MTTLPCGLGPGAGSPPVNASNRTNSLTAERATCHLYMHLTDGNRAGHTWEFRRWRCCSYHHHGDRRVAWVGLTAVQMAPKVDKAVARATGAHRRSFAERLFRTLQVLVAQLASGGSCEYGLHTALARQRDDRAPGATLLRYAAWLRFHALPRESNSANTDQHADQQGLRANLGTS